MILLKLNAVKGVVTKEEFTKFFVSTTNREAVLERYLQFTGKSRDNEFVCDINKIFDDMFDNLDNEVKAEDEEGRTLTFRRYLLILMKNIKEKNSDNKLAYVDLQRSPWLPVFMTIFALTGTGITCFIKLWLIKKSGENNKKTQQDFENYLESGVVIIICNPLFVCSLVFGWALLIQMVLGVIFVLSNLLSLLLACDSISTCYCIRKNAISPAEYRNLLPKVENYLNQGKDDNENKEIKEEELEKKGKGKDENKNENQEKPEEEMSEKKTK